MDGASDGGGLSVYMARLIRYCRVCVTPQTRPNLIIDEQGVCSGCRNFQARQFVNWDRRLEDLRAILDHHRNPSGYDCIVPVSGGKDSHTQVLKMLELGMRPLAVTASTCHLSALGRRNLDNIARLGVDHIEVTTDRRVRRVLNRLGLRLVGDISWPEHVSIFTIPVRIAVQLGIPLLIWGENPENEHGGPAGDASNNILTRRWLEEFGGLNGLRVADMVGKEGLSERDLIQYTYPSDAELRRVGVTGLFLGHYVPWDGLGNARLAYEHGFQWSADPVESHGFSYENLDNLQTSIHDYLMWCKFGYSRATNIASFWVRRGRMTRSDAVAHIREWDGRYPHTYLGVPLAEILDGVMGVAEFDAICDRFTNRAIFRRDADGALVRREDGSPARINDDSVEADRPLALAQVT